MILVTFSLSLSRRSHPWGVGGGSGGFETQVRRAVFMDVTIREVNKFFARSSQSQLSQTYIDQPPCYHTAQARTTAILLAIHTSGKHVINLISYHVAFLFFVFIYLGTSHVTWLLQFAPTSIYRAQKLIYIQLIYIQLIIFPFKLYVTSILRLRDCIYHVCVQMVQMWITIQLALCLLKHTYNIYCYIT